MKPRRMWESDREVLQDGQVHRLVVRHDGANLKYSAAVESWQSDAEFRAFFISLLEEAPFAAYFWETPPITGPTFARPFEFVLVDSASLARMHADSSDFSGYFDAAGSDEAAVGFSNLGDDAFLIAPCPRAPEPAYTHLAAFVRKAPKEQQHALWQAVGAAVERRLDARPLWLSTSGGGVPWLHVRLDSRPKYYTYDPYRWSD